MDLPISYKSLLTFYTVKSTKSIVFTDSPVLDPRYATSPPKGGVTLRDGGPSGVMLRDRGSRTGLISRVL